MNQLKNWLALSTFSGCYILSAAASAADLTRQEIIVKFEAGCTPEATAEINRAMGTEPVHDFGNGLMLVRLLKEKKVSDAVRRYEKADGVEFAEANRVIRGTKLESRRVSGPSEQWWHLNDGTRGEADADMDTIDAWNLRSDASGVVVAVLDGGVDTRHADLKANIFVNTGEVAGNGVDDDANGLVDDVHGYDFASGDSDPDDETGHGTCAAGLIGAQGNNRVGGDGVCWKVQILPVKVLGEERRGTLSDWLRGMEYALSKGSTVIYAGWDGVTSKSLASMLQRAEQKGALYVAPAGDNRKDLDSSFPRSGEAQATNLIRVAATDRRDRLSVASNYGKEAVHVAAPGHRVISTAPGTKYVEVSGTAAAAAQVAGAVALLKAHGGGTPAGIRDRLLQSTDRVAGTEGKVSSGRLNIFGAILDATPPEQIARDREEGAFGGYKCAPGELLVRFRKSIDEDRRNAILAEMGCTMKDELTRGTAFNLRLPGSRSIPEAIRLCRKYPEIEFNEPNYALKLVATVPNDPRFAASQYCHQNTGQTGGTADADMDTTEAWDLRTDASSVVVAVIDTGVDYDHEDLAANMWRNPGETPGNGVDDDGNGYVDDVFGIDAANSDSDPDDDNEHGTHCSGIIGGAGNNGTGVAGVCWNVRIMAAKFLDSNGSGYTSAAVQCINYAVAQGAHVLSNSWGGGGFSQSLYNAIQNANSNGVIFVAASGNESNNNDSSPSYPASYNLPNVISVAASNHNDGLASFSNYGASSVHLAAPGVSIMSSTPNNGYQSFSGTSMACPQVAGACALLRAHDGSLDHLAIRQRLFDTVDPKPAFAGSTTTGGRLNVFNALNASSNPQPGLPDLTVTSVDAPDRGRQGETISVTATIRNGGAEDVAAAVSVSYYLSDDAAITTSDALLGSSAIAGGLAAGQSQTEVQVLTIPAGAADGYHYVGAVVDAENAIEESNEGNNSRADAGRIIIGDPFSYGELALDAMVTGSTGSEPMSYAYYRVSLTGGMRYVFETHRSATTPALSDTVMSLYGTWDSVQGPSGLLALDDDGGSGYYSKITFSAQTSADYYVEIRGYANATGHFDLMASLDSKPDLVIASMTANPAEVNPGGSTIVTVVIENRGDAPSAASEMTVNLDGTEIAASPIPVSALAAGESAGFNVPVDNLSAGPDPHVVQFIADSGQAIAEDDETNNVGQIEINVIGEPDLIIENLVASPTSVAPGDSVTLSFDVTNQGDSAAVASTAALYVSGEFTAEFAVGALASGDSSSLTYSIEVPASAVGSLAVLARADESDDVDEEDESNNEGTLDVSVGGAGPDLVVSSLRAQTYARGSFVRVIFRVKNQGDERTGRYSWVRVTICRSSDGSQVVSRRWTKVGNLREGRSVRRRVDARMRRSVSSGDLFAVVTADAWPANGGRVAESNEDNNTKQKSFRYRSRNRRGR